MNTTTAATPTSGGVAKTSAFWGGLWRTACVKSVALFVVAYVIHGTMPRVAAVLSGLAVLNLMWFAAAIRTTLADAGRDGWGATATASSAAVGALLLLLLSAGDQATGFAWGWFVMSSFPRAMLIMAGTFGLWRAGLISNSAFAAGVA